MNISKLKNVTKSFVRANNEHCLVLTLSRDRTGLEAIGASVWVNVLEDKPELLLGLTNALVEASEARDLQNQILDTGVFPKQLPRLFAVPSSREWKGVKVRSQLSTYLAFFGHGHNMSKKYGEGQPPIGWPVQVDWSTFKGPSKSCTLVLCKEIICQLLEAQGVDPENHGPIETDEALVEDEGQDDANEIEEVPQVALEVDDEPARKRKRIIGNPTQKKLKINEMLERQAREERTLPVLQRRNKNIKEIQEGLRELEDEDTEMEEGELTDEDD